MLEDALRERFLGRIAFTRNTFGTDDDHFAGLHVVEIDRVDQVERAGFRSEDVGWSAAAEFELSHRQRPESLRIAGYDQAVFSEADERKGAFQLQKRVAQRVFECLLPRVRNEVQNDFRVA